MKKQDSVAFQAADMLAYEHRLANIKVYESGIGTIGFQELRKSLIALNAFLTMTAIGVCTILRRWKNNASPITTR